VVQTAVLGAGAWGTALAIHLARRLPAPAHAGEGAANSIVLFARDPEQCKALRADRENRKYLPGVPLDPAIRVVATPAEALAQSRLVMLAVPVAALRPLLLQDLGQWATEGLPRFLVWLCKGIETGTGLLPHQIVAQCFPNIEGAALSGPSFAQEVAAGLPVALVAASRSLACIDAIREATHHSACRIYASGDLVGVELGGALKNVVAIAAGVSDGLGMGNNARAALLTRGLAEIARLGRCLGASPQTFMGLSGLGDLLLTATGDLSRNRQVGIRLAGGESLLSILATLGHVAEGVSAAATALRLAVRHKVDMPITQAVHALLSGTSSPRQALEALLAREVRTESELAEPSSTS
jgi:glycerol-3-phosphate dehydrogenase (NAD(P)+)